MKTYLITEACFHASYLVQMAAINHPDLQVILRDKLNLSRELVSAAHEELQGKKALSAQEFAMLENAYGAPLSKAENALIRLHGVPKRHIFSLPVAHMTTNFNSKALLDTLELESFRTELSAIIFLDCILKPQWLEIFERRIVNGHSAILPHARGMHAIEQTAAIGDPDRMQKSAGATIHYIDERVDMGALIKVKPVEHLWDHQDIWEVKASSYLAAFELLTSYLSQSLAFSHKDARAYTDAIGPEFKLRDFTTERSTKAELSFLSMREQLQQIEHGTTHQFSPRLG